MLFFAKEEAKNCQLHIASEIWVPGAMELPLALKKILQRKDHSYQGVVVLGLIEKGETAHGLVMAQNVLNFLFQLQLEFCKPLGVGILGPEILPEQIEARLSPYAKAAVSALKEMLKI